MESTTIQNAEHKLTNWPHYLLASLEASCINFEFAHSLNMNKRPTDMDALLEMDEW